MSGGAERRECYDPLKITVVEVYVERGYMVSDDWDGDNTGEVDDLHHLYNPEE